MPESQRPHCSQVQTYVYNSKVIVVLGKCVNLVSYQKSDHANIYTVHMTLGQAARELCLAYQSAVFTDVNSQSKPMKVTKCHTDVCFVFMLVWASRL